jgi:hypothetical protein
MQASINSGTIKTGYQEHHEGIEESQAMQDNTHTRKEPYQTAAWARTGNVSVLRYSPILCGVMQHPVTNYWQTWISLYRTDITLCTAHRSRTDAEAIIAAFNATWARSKLRRTEEVVSYFRQIPADVGKEYLMLPSDIELHRLQAEISLAKKFDQPGTAAAPLRQYGLPIVEDEPPDGMTARAVGREYQPLVARMLDDSSR